jgi:hypothetical protein
MIVLTKPRHLFLPPRLFNPVLPNTILHYDDKGDLVADSRSTLARWRNGFSQILNVHGANDVRQTEIHTAQSPVPEPSASEIEVPIEKLKTHRSSGYNRWKQ